MGHPLGIRGGGKGKGLGYRFPFNLSRTTPVSLALPEGMTSPPAILSALAGDSASSTSDDV